MPLDRPSDRARRRRAIAAAAAAGLAALGIGPVTVRAADSPANPIQHVVIVMQENRSFDHYFGTFPGADGIPAGTCVPLNPGHGGPVPLASASNDLSCVAPFHDPHDANGGGPHLSGNAEADLDNGIDATRMDGFLRQQWTAFSKCKPDASNCAVLKPGVLRHDAVGYHTDEEIPNYWAYARHFVLQDRLFEGVRSWSWPSHLDLTSEWVAACTNYADVSTCKTAPTLADPGAAKTLPWVSLFQLLDSKGVSWKYYLGTGPEPDCEDGEMTCYQPVQTAGVGSIWNPPPFFSWVQSQGTDYIDLHNPDVSQFIADVAGGTLPQVSWIVPTQNVSEHPPAGVTAGMVYVTSLVNAVMQSPYWQNTAIFIAWDDWGGFYDHVPPPNVDRNDTATPIQGFGLRVPGLLISAYAKPGYIDHSVLSFDSYATFVEDLFMDGARLDPAALGNPDSRPDIRDALTTATFPDGQQAPIGNLMDEFDFTQAPLPPLILSTHIPTGITATCGPAGATRCTSETVTISWAPITGSEIPGPFTYHVERDGAELRQCIGQVPACQDNPGPGAHLYRAYSVASNGVASPRSAAAEADMPPYEPPGAPLAHPLRAADRP